MSALVKIAVALFVAGEAAILVSVGVESWPVLAGWAVAALVTVAVASLVRRPVPRVVLAAVLLVGCALTTFEGGLFFVPAAMALLLAAVIDHQRGGRAVPRAT